MNHLLRVDDLTDDEISRVLSRADAFARKNTATALSAMIGLIFLEPSLRTRVGFAAAAARLGCETVSVTELRPTGPNFAESWEDTLRVVSGYCNVVVARPGRAEFAETLSSACPIINAGNEGHRAEHPSQALIDLFAIERFRGPIEMLTVAIVGDARMRSVRSLIALFERRRPRQTIVITDPNFVEGEALPAKQWMSVTNNIGAAHAADVVYVAGIPHQALDIAARGALVVDEKLLSELPRDAVLLSPMPVMDELTAAVRRDTRARFHEQSDLGVFVRMAILELALARE